ncbi:MAG: hypothetical protein WBE20_00360 [Candidatus Acidiferrales bacterium]
MRSFPLAFLLGCLTATVLFAAPQSGSPRRQISLDGTELTLGMPEEAAIKQLAESAYTLQRSEPPQGLRAKGITSMWFVATRDKHLPIGTLLFADGKLSGVVDYLLPTDGDAVEFGRRLYFAMRDLELEGDSHCIIETENAEVPDLAHKTANLRCGQKTIVIDLQKFKGQVETVQLQEELWAR